MSKISDEIREWCDLCGGIIDSDDKAKLHALADRIDSEMVELPKDRDGVPIHVGDTALFVGRDDVEFMVDHITFFKDKTRVVAMSDEHAVYSNPTDFTHTRPDSWERIADELDDWTAVLADCDVDAAHEFAERIRRLAEKEGER